MQDPSFHMSLPSVTKMTSCPRDTFKKIIRPLVTGYQRLNRDREIEAFYKIHLQKQLLLITTVTLICLAKELIAIKIQQLRFQQSSIHQTAYRATGTSLDYTHQGHVCDCNCTPWLKWIWKTVLTHRGLWRPAPSGVRVTQPALLLLLSI